MGVLPVSSLVHSADHRGVPKFFRVYPEGVLPEDGKAHLLAYPDRPDAALEVEGAGGRHREIEISRRPARRAGPVPA